MTPEDKKVYMRQWRQAHKEQIRAQKMAYYLAHREQELAKQKARRVPSARRSAEWKAAKPDRLKANNLKYRLKVRGLTVEQYQSMRTAQNDLCAICGQPETRTSKNGRFFELTIDHNHITGENRELLCHNCNVGIGNFHEDIDKMQAAIDYLNKHLSSEKPSGRSTSREGITRIGG